MYVPALLHSLFSGQRLVVWTTTYADCTIFHTFVTRAVISSTDIFEIVAIRVAHRFCQRATNTKEYVYDFYHSVASYVEILWVRMQWRRRGRSC